MPFLRPRPAQTVRPLILLSAPSRCLFQLRPVCVLVELEPSAISNRLFQAGIGLGRHPDLPLLAALSLHMNPSLQLTSAGIVPQTITYTLVIGDTVKRYYRTTKTSSGPPPQLLPDGSTTRTPDSPRHRPLRPAVLSRSILIRVVNDQRRAAE